MSSSDRVENDRRSSAARTQGRASGPRRAAALLVAGLSMAGCTVQPLYGTSAQTGSLAGSLDKGPVQTDLAALRGQIGVAPASNRTAQIFRDALLFRLNGGQAPTAPVYEIRYGVTGTETVTSIQQGSGIPAASSYRMTVTYQVLRLADGKLVAAGTRFASAPFDRSTQLYASTRALADARELAGRSAAERVELAVVDVIRKDIRL